MFRCFLCKSSEKSRASGVLAALILSAFLVPACFGLDLQAFDTAGLYSLAELEPNLTGAGLNIGLLCRSEFYSGFSSENNYLPDIEHRCLKEAKIEIESGPYDTGDISSHATAVASIICGDYSDVNLPDSEFLSAPCRDSQLSVYEFRSFLIKYIFAKSQPDIDLLSVSLGWSFEDWWTRGFDRMAERYGVLVIAAIGNGRDGYDLPLYPAAGANILAVGVADSVSRETGFGPADVNHSTAGPTADGRCKPDIISPGNCLIADAGSEDGFSQSGDYSSFAAPVVTSVAALLIQKAKQDPNLAFAASPFMSNCILKSILMTSAVKSDSWHKGLCTEDDDSQYPLDLTQGSGMVNAVSAYRLLTAGMQFRGDVGTDGWSIDIIEPDYEAQNVYRFKTDKSENQKLCATVVWNRPYRNEYPFEPMWENFADLQVELWKVSDSGKFISVDFSDSPVDNLEHLWTTLEPDSRYEIVVSNSPDTELAEVASMYAIAWQIH